MSAIKNKPFDPKKRIARTEFMGYPNLITSADLNRQTEGTNWVVNQVEGMVGLHTDIKIVSESFTDPTYKVTFGATSIICRGCSFTPAFSEMTFTFNTVGQEYYINLYAYARMSTYSDGNMSIAGAEFEDGTTLAAANQIIYYNESVKSSSAPLNEPYVIIGQDNLIGILGKLVYDGTNVKFYSNEAGYTPMAIKQQEFIQTTNTTVNNIETNLNALIDKRLIKAGSTFYFARNESVAAYTSLAAMSIEFYQDLVYSNGYVETNWSRLVGSVPVYPIRQNISRFTNFSTIMLDEDKPLHVRINLMALYGDLFEPGLIFYVSDLYISLFELVMSADHSEFYDKMFEDIITYALAAQVTFTFTVPAKFISSTGQLLKHIRVQGTISRKTS